MPGTVIASACLCGITCRWHGDASPVSATVRRLHCAGVRVIPICPEMLGGLPCPRSPVKIRQGRVFETDAKTRTRIGTERSFEFRLGASKAVTIAREAGARRAYLFRLSPSCAPSGITGKLMAASGITVIPSW